MKKFDNYWWLRTTCIIVWVCVGFLMFSTAKLYSSTIGRTNEKIAERNEVQKVQDAQEVYINNNYNITNITVICPQENLNDIALKIKDATSIWDKNNDYDLNYAYKLACMIQSAAERNNLSLSLGLAIVHIESDFKSTAKSSCGAVGLCQVMPNCLEEYNYKSGRYNYTMEDMLDPEKNLEVGFWYYNRIATHYNNCYNYITKTSEATEFRDCYIAYNYGVTAFNDIGRWGRNELRQGRYPENKYNSKKGDSYSPINRLKEISQIYL